MTKSVFAHNSPRKHVYFISSLSHEDDSESAFKNYTVDNINDIICKIFVSNIRPSLSLTWRASWSLVSCKPTTVKRVSGKEVGRISR